jgi:hypothetical protein
MLSGALLGLLLALGWIFWSAERHRRFDGRGGLSSLLKISREIPAGGRYQGDPYIGHQVCAECHPGEYALYSGSGHALTMRAAADRTLSDRLSGRTVQDPERPEARWTYSKQRGEFILERLEREKIERFVIDYAIGSGHHATSFVTVLNLDPPTILEHRLTHYTSTDTLDITPGQTSGKAAPGTTLMGREQSVRETLKCLGCHATQLSARPAAQLDPASLIPSVTCERCHGPGRAHVQAARRGASASELAMPMGLEGWTVQGQLDLCGNCHRHPSKVPPLKLNPNDPILARFQPIGLSQSRCFKESGGRFSCVSCHDPHARSTSDRAHYERVCLNCHQTSGTGKSRRTLSSFAATSTCPISPLKGCVICHMPGVDSGQHVLFTDHWIRVRRPATDR